MNNREEVVTSLEKVIEKWFDGDELIDTLPEGIWWEPHLTWSMARAAAEILVTSINSQRFAKEKDGE